MARLPHDRSELLVKEDGATELFLSSIDRWVDAMVADEHGGGDAHSKLVVASVKAKQAGILCGNIVVERLLERHFDAVAVDWNFTEGEQISVGDIVCELHGDSADILRAERIFLNLLGRMSGIATLTTKWNEEAENLGVACTRKTEWGLLDKWAVHIGGGLTHRLDRADALMLKENDLAVRSEDEEESIALVRMIEEINLEKHAKFTIIEVRNAEQAITAALAWKELQNERSGKEPIVLLLDNMGAGGAKEVEVSLIELNLRDWCILEGSGGVTLDSIPEWNESGCDLISTSALNRGVAPLDLSMIIEEGAA